MKSGRNGIVNNCRIGSGYDFDFGRNSNSCDLKIAKSTVRMTMGIKRQSISIPFGKRRLTFFV
ncbi:hypothetical protein CHUAL_010183, partial [Chamberlinius hualienensis]